MASDEARAVGDEIATRVKQRVAELDAAAEVPTKITGTR
jgi:hypothetical protein